MDKSELLRLARLGAEERLRRLTEEVDAIYRHFPELRRPAARVDQKTVRRVQTRRRMSAAQRKMVSDRMKKYWAARRKQSE